MSRHDIVLVIASNLHCFEIDLFKSACIFVS